MIKTQVIQGHELRDGDALVSEIDGGPLRIFSIWRTDEHVHVRWYDAGLPCAYPAAIPADRSVTIYARRPRTSWTPRPSTR